MGYDMYLEKPVMGEDGQDESYFRLNIFGMQRYREYMADLEMIHQVGYEHAMQLLNSCGDDDPTEDDYEDALRWAPEAPAICAWKLGSNDGWLVTPIECLGAIKAWESHGSPNPLAEDGEAAEANYWNQWIDFLRRAAVNGGFRVF